MTRIIVSAIATLTAASAAQAHVERGHPTGAMHPFAHLLDNPAGVVVLAALAVAAGFAVRWLSGRR